MHIEVLPKGVPWDTADTHSACPTGCSLCTILLLLLLLLLLLH
jgi:hypothetical protein